jgi:hypothetical protein
VVEVIWSAGTDGQRPIQRRKAWGLVAQRNGIVDARYEAGEGEHGMRELANVRTSCRQHRTVQDHAGPIARRSRQLVRVCAHEAVVGMNVATCALGFVGLRLPTFNRRVPRSPNQVNTSHSSTIQSPWDEHTRYLIVISMPADRLLSTLLRSLQTYTDQQDTPRYANREASHLWARL